MYMTTQDVARRLGVAAATVRQLANNGKLPATRTFGGTRLYEATDVDKLARERSRNAHNATPPLPFDVAGD